MSRIWLTPEPPPSQILQNQKIWLKNSTKSDFGQWHAVAYFSRKMISAETRYETHGAELLAIVLAIIEAFKNWRHYLGGCKLEVFTDHLRG